MQAIRSEIPTKSSQYINYFYDRSENLNSEILLHFSHISTKIELTYNNKIKQTVFGV